MPKEVEVKTGTVVRQRGMSLPAHIESPAPLPDHLEGLFDLRTWFDSLTRGIEYNEPNPDYMSQRMLYLTLTSATPDAVLTPNDITGLQDLVPNVPGGETGNILITDLYVAASDQKDGNKTYILFSFVSDATGLETTTTTGATQVQAQLLTLLAHGQWPIHCNIKRTERKDRGDRFLFWVFPADE